MTSVTSGPLPFLPASPQHYLEKKRKTNTFGLPKFNTASKNLSTLSSDVFLISFVRFSEGFCVSYYFICIYPLLWRFYFRHTKNVIVYKSHHLDRYKTPPLVTSLIMLADCFFMLLSFFRHVFACSNVLPIHYNTTISFL